MSGAFQQLPVPVPLGMGGTGTSVGFKPASTTVGSLPSASVHAGEIFVVTDSLLPALGGIIAAGGAVKVMVWSDGTNWLVV